MNYELIEYDVWGNPEDGWDLNNIFKTGIVYDLDSTKENGEIIRDLIEQGFLTVTCNEENVGIDMNFDDDGYASHIYLDDIDDSNRPMCRFERVS